MIPNILTHRRSLGGNRVSSSRTSVGAEPGRDDPTKEQYSSDHILDVHQPAPSFAERCAKLPGPLARALKRKKPRYRPRSASAAGYSSWPRVGWADAVPLVRGHGSRRPQRGPISTRLVRVAPSGRARVGLPTGGHDEVLFPVAPILRRDRPVHQNDVALPPRRGRSDPARSDAATGPGPAGGDARPVPRRTRRRRRVHVRLVLAGRPVRTRVDPLRARPRPGDEGDPRGIKLVARNRRTGGTERFRDPRSCWFVTGYDLPRRCRTSGGAGGLKNRAVNSGRDGVFTPEPHARTTHASHEHEPCRHDGNH